MTSNSLLFSIDDSETNCMHENSSVAYSSDQEKLTTGEGNFFDLKLDSTEGECAPLLLERHFHSNQFSGKNIYYCYCLYLKRTVKTKLYKGFCSKYYSSSIFISFFIKY